MRDKPDFYDIGDLRLFFVAPRIYIRTKDKELSPSPMHGSFLLALARKSPAVISYKELWEDVWRSKHEMSEDDRAKIQTTKNQLTTWLKANNINSLLIEAEPGKGYRLKNVATPGWFDTYPVADIPSVPPTRNEGFPKDDSAPESPVSGSFADGSKGDLSESQIFDKSDTLFALAGIVVGLFIFGIGMRFRVCLIECLEQTIFIILASVFYGALAGIGTLLECAYQFDRYGWKVAKMIPSIFLVSAGAMFAGLTVAGNLLSRGVGPAFMGGLLFLVVGASASCVLASFVLPNLPVTAAKFQTQSAFAAFCKNVFVYFLPLYTVFGLLIFCFIYNSPGRF